MSREFLLGLLQSRNIPGDVYYSRRRPVGWMWFSLSTPQRLGYNVADAANLIRKGVMDFMANHAFVIPRKGYMPHPDKINEDAQEIVARKFKQFVLEYTPGDENWHWTLKYQPYDGYIRLVFRYRKEYPYKKPLRPCLEFRHGHIYDFMWWVEYEIREELALRYRATCIDEGDMKSSKPQVERYDNYTEYLIKTRPDDPITRKYLQQHLDLQRERLPEDLKHFLPPLE